MDCSRINLAGGDPLEASISIKWQRHQNLYIDERKISSKIDYYSTSTSLNVKQNRSIDSTNKGDQHFEPNAAR